MIKNEICKPVWQLAIHLAQVMAFFSNLIFWVQYNSKYISFEDPNFTVDFPAFSWQPNTVL
jgi:hypothetical protein